MIKNLPFVNFNLATKNIHIIYHKFTCIICPNFENFHQLLVIHVHIKKYDPSSQSYAIIVQLPACQSFPEHDNQQRMLIDLDHAELKKEAYSLFLLCQKILSNDLPENMPHLHCKTIY